MVLSWSLGGIACHGGVDEYGLGTSASSSSVWIQYRTEQDIEQYLIRQTGRISQN